MRQLQKRCRLFTGHALAMAAITAWFGCSEPAPVGDDICGDGVLQAGEVCDLSNLDGETCESLGFGPGVLGCHVRCDAFETSQCGPPDSCGNGVKDSVEVCDGDMLDGATCESLGFGPGALTCQVNCAGYDSEQCGALASCGDGEHNGTEVCDGDQLAGATCESLGFGPGVLTCLDNCSDYDSSQCSPQPFCGDGMINGDELCDTDDLDGMVCTDFDSYGAGSLACAADCQSFDETGCEVCDLAAFTMDTVLNIDVPVITISGTVTLNGASMPDDTDLDGFHRGWLEFRDTATNHTVTAFLGETGASMFDVELFAGTYDILVQSRDAQYQTVLPDGARALLRSGVVFDTDTIQNFDLRVITVSGDVTLNGAVMPDDTDLDGFHRGWLDFRDKATNHIVSAFLGETGASVYSVELFAGAYDILVQSRDVQYQTVLPDGARTMLDSAVVFDVDTTKNLDLRVVTVSGEATRNGVVMPDDEDLDGFHRGWLDFRDRSTNHTVSAFLGETGPSLYTIELFAGSYDITVTSRDAEYQTVLPDGARTMLDSEVVFDVDTTRNLDLRVIVVSGEVTRNGAVMPDDEDLDGFHRGWLDFRDRSTNHTVSAFLGETGPSVYSVELFAASYDILVTSRDAQYQTVLPDGAHTVLETGVMLDMDTTKNIDLVVITLSGEVTRNGAVMPDDEDLDGFHRGWLDFRDVSTNHTVSAFLGEIGPAMISVELFGGAYDILVTSRDAQYQTVLPDGARSLLEEAMPLVADTVQNLDLRVLTLSGEVTRNGVTMPDDMDLDGFHRGWLEFHDTATNHTVTAFLGEIGPATYAIDMFAGSFDILIQSRDAQYQTVLPDGVRSRLYTGCRTIE